MTLEEIIDHDLQPEVQSDDDDDAYEDVDDDDAMIDHPPDSKPVKAQAGKTEKGGKPGKPGKPEQTGVGKSGRQAELEKPTDDEEKDEDAESTPGSDDPDGGGQGGGPGGNPPAVPDNKGTIEVPKESHNTVIVGLKVYTHKDVGCSVEGRLRMGCKDPNCTLCAPPVIVTIPAVGTETVGDD